MARTLARKIALWSLWLSLVGYAFVAAPPNQPDTATLIQDLSTGNWAGINPLVIALFNLMGVLPLLYSCFLYSDGRMQRVPAWPFAIASFGVGAFALLPYLALREPAPTFTGEKSGWLKLWESRWLAIAIALAAIGLLFYGLTQGDWSDFIQQWQTSRFIHVMSLDFCLLCLLPATLLGDDMARRGIHNPRVFWATALIPLLGPLVYLVGRPALQTDSHSSAETSVAST